eukprot:Hpha_TRINITY_DN1522_c0_g1::TRINITY_DN1522_c0_g1_i1::g.57137::m.57137/K01137/GNS; N-acetylglucosamine-6-sulfatase
MLSLLSAATLAAAPNILFILTDDQDLLLGSVSKDGPCKTIVREIGEAGVTFQNAFANTPICCPSRAEIQTGRLMHNTQVLNNGCGGQAFIDGPEKMNVAAVLKKSKADYQTFYAGKYLNNYGQKSVGGTARIPPGWDQWYGLVGNSKYYDYTVSNQGVAEKHGSDYATDYFTDRVANRSLAFLEEQLEASKPFFMMLGTPASHGPNTPAPQYSETYAGMRAPRLPSYNVTGQPGKQRLLRDIIPMDETHANVTDVFFQRRWSVLRSVDDMVARLLATLKQYNALDNTFILYTADHGYHLGEFGMLYDKRMLFETDIRVPFFVRGPGVTQGVYLPQPVGHIDIAPTILDMAGVTAPDVMDGRSWLPLAQGSQEGPWRSALAVEYSGGNSLPNGEGGSIEVKSGDVCEDMETEDNAFAGSINLKGAKCGANASDELSITGACSCSVGRFSGEQPHDISPCDNKNNTYACVRTLSTSENSIYCEFNDPEGHKELYDLSIDPYNLNNAYASANSTWQAALHSRLLRHQRCKGAECFIVEK